MTAGRTVNSASKDWGTPRKYVEAVTSLPVAIRHLAAPLLSQFFAREPHDDVNGIFE